MSIFSFFRRGKKTEEQTKPLPVQEALEPTRRIDLKAIQEELARRDHSTVKGEKSGRAASSQSHKPADPVFPVGWLAVVNGPGRGRILSLQTGVNAIGSGSQAHVRLDFGDAAIAESDHAILSYNAARREFHLLPGQEGADLMLNEAAVKTTATLQGGEFLTLGNTRLRFVALCGKDFDW